MAEKRQRPKRATALFLDVPAVRASLAWADAVHKLVAALEVIADPAHAAAPYSGPASTALARVELVPPPAAPLHDVLRVADSFQALLVSSPVELIAGLVPGVPALWINRPAGATQIGTALLAIAMTVPGDAIGFQKFYAATEARTRSTYWNWSRNAAASRWRSRTPPACGSSNGSRLPWPSYLPRHWAASRGCERRSCAFSVNGRGRPRRTRSGP